MDKERLIEQLNQAVDSLLANSDVAQDVDTELRSLLRVAIDLRALPRAAFKETLRNDLKKVSNLTMNTEATVRAVNPVREGFRTVTPYIAVHNVHAVIDFVKAVFGAEGNIYGTGSQGGIHSEYRIGDSMLMIGGGENWQGEEKPGAFHIYVENVDETFQRAIAAGATSLHPPTDQEYGERSAAFTDPAGNQWFPATAFGATFIAEGAQNLMPFLHPRGAAKQIEYLQQAFGAIEQFRYASPDGVIQHAKIQIGSAIIEMGEAHDRWQPMRSMFMLYVEDVDAMYARAAGVEGTTAVNEPADQPYGDRVGAIKDPFGNLWYIASHIRDLG